MKRPLRLLSALAVLPTLLAAPRSAQPEPGYERQWKHFGAAVFIGGGLQLPAGGDLDGKSVVRVNPGDTSSTQGDFLDAEPHAGPSVSAGVGARMDGNRVFAAVERSSFSTEHRLLAKEVDAERWRISLDWRHDFRQEEPWRPEVGFGAHFALVDVDGSFLPKSGAARDARLSGTGFHVDCGVGWWFRERVAIVAEAEYSFDASRNIGLGDEGFRLDGYLVEHRFALNLQAWALF